MSEPSSAAAAEGERAALESDKEFFGATGYEPPEVVEARRYPRYLYKSFVKATVHSLRDHAEPPQQCTIMTRDLSRGGFSFLHVGQLFPGQRMDVVLADGLERLVEVQWCRRLHDRCYLGGCRFVPRHEE